MAEIDTVALSREHSDIRREQAEQTSNIRREAGVNTNEIVREGLKESFNIRGDVKDSRYDVASRMAGHTTELSKQVDAIDDTLTAHLFTIARESADNRAQILALGFQVRDGFVTSAKDSEINALKTQIETAKQTTYLSDKIDGQAEKTRELINELKNSDLNRMLIERTNEIVEHRHEGRHWRGHYDNAQYAGLVSQINALNSSFQDSKQSMVNFGSMLGTSQAASNNSVR
jgi:hypothetical protein